MRTGVAFDPMSGMYRPTSGDGCGADGPEVYTVTSKASSDVEFVVGYALDELRRDLALPAVTVKYFRPETRERKAWREQRGTTPWESFKGTVDLKGMVKGADHLTVWLRSDLGEEDALEVLSHELKHCQIFERYVRLYDEDIASEADQEREAYQFGQKIRRMLPKIIRKERAA